MLIKPNELNTGVKFQNPDKISCKLKFSIVGCDENGKEISGIDKTLLSETWLEEKKEVLIERFSESIENVLARVDSYVSDKREVKH